MGREATHVAGGGVQSGGIEPARLTTTLPALGPRGLSMGRRGGCTRPREAYHALSKGVAVAAAYGADGGDRARLRAQVSVTDGDVLRAGSGVLNEPVEAVE